MMIICLSLINTSGNGRHRSIKQKNGIGNKKYTRNSQVLILSWLINLLELKTFAIFPVRKFTPSE